MSDRPDLDDELDRRLSAAGEAWRSRHVPVPVEGPVDVPEQRGQPWLMPVAVAAVVALLAGGAAVATDVLRGHRDGSAPVDSLGHRWDPDLPPGLLPAEVPGTVPPVNQRVEHPVAEAAGAFTPALVATLGRPACRASDVELSSEPGRDAGEVRFTVSAVRADTACVVSRNPFLEYSRGGRPAEVPTASEDPAPGDWPAAVLLTADQRAVLPTTWSGWCHDLPFDSVRMYFEDNSFADAAVPQGVATCRGGEPDEMHVAGWEPEGFTFRPAGSFAGLRARLVDTVTGPEDLPTWVVELTATRDVDLDTCPSWEVQRGEEHTASWRLNCAGVPDRRADGTPYLPAGKPVRFAVWTPYGGNDAALTWRLTTPDGPVSVPLAEGPAAPTGEPREVTEREANVHLYVTIGFRDPVPVTLSIDGVPLLAETVEHQGGAAPLPVQLAVPAGRHTLRVESGTGATRDITLDVPEHGDQWAQVEVWDDPAQHGRGSIEWTTQRSPMYFG